MIGFVLAFWSISVFFLVSSKAFGAYTPAFYTSAIDKAGGVGISYDRSSTIEWAGGYIRFNQVPFNRIAPSEDNP